MSFLGKIRAFLSSKHPEPAALESKMETLKQEKRDTGKFPPVTDSVIFASDRRSLLSMLRRRGNAFPQSIQRKVTSITNLQDLQLSVNDAASDSDTRRASPVAERVDNGEVDTSEFKPFLGLNDTITGRQVIPLKQTANKTNWTAKKVLFLVIGLPTALMMYLGIGIGAVKEAIWAAKNAIAPAAKATFLHVLKPVGVAVFCTPAGQIALGCAAALVTLTLITIYLYRHREQIKDFYRNQIIPKVLIPIKNFFVTYLPYHISQPAKYHLQRGSMRIRHALTPNGHEKKSIIRQLNKLEQDIKYQARKKALNVTINEANEEFATNRTYPSSQESTLRYQGLRKYYKKELMREKLNERAALEDRYVNLAAGYRDRENQAELERFDLNYLSKRDDQTNHYLSIYPQDTKANDRHQALFRKSLQRPLMQFAAEDGKEGDGVEIPSERTYEPLKPVVAEQKDSSPHPDEMDMNNVEEEPKQ